MPSFAQLQQKFHLRPDTKRFWNRIQNPFLITKERQITRVIHCNLPASGPDLLEVGCGEGSNLYYLKKVYPGAQMVGLDFSIEKILFCSHHLRNGVGVVGNATNLPFKNTVFEIVVCRDLLHHLDWAREIVMSEALRVTKPGGKLFIIESNGKKLLNQIFQALFPVERGMKNSYPANLLKLGRQFGETRLEFIEGSMFLRALAYLFGWPSGWMKYLLIPLYSSAYIWEKIYEMITPKSRWAYMLMTITRN